MSYNPSLNVIGKSAKYIVAGTAAIVMLQSDSWIPVSYVIAGCLNALLSKLAKAILKQPRPVGANKTGYGMPSSHAQSIFFFSFIISIKFGEYISSLSSINPKIQFASTAFIGLLLFSYSFFACYWRIKSKFHDYSQTIIGALFGLFIGGLSLYYESDANKLLISLFHSPVIVNSKGVQVINNDWQSILFRIIVSIVGISAVFSKEIKYLINKFMTNKNNIETKNR
eukprot:gene13657-18329_t